MDIALTSDSDIDITGGTLSLVTERDAIAQHMRIRLRFFLGEWFLDRREGIPYFRDILIKNPSRAVVTSTLKRVMLETPGIAAVDKFALEIDRETRAGTITWEVTTDSGAVLTSDDYGPLILGEV